MAFATPTDRPKSDRNRCLIEVLVAVFVLSRRFLNFSVGVGAFIIGLSQTSSFFSYNVYYKIMLECLIQDRHRQNISRNAQLQAAASSRSDMLAVYHTNETSYRYNTKNYISLLI